MAKINLSEKQKERLKILEPKFKDSLKRKDLETAKSLAVDIQSLLRPTKHFNRIVQNKNSLYELALELGQIEFAISGLISNRATVSKNTRLHLEATSLLAICFLRKKDVENAKPLIKEVLTNYSFIKTERTRKEFRAEIIERFDEEAALYSLKEIGIESFTEDELEAEVIRLVTTQNESEIFEQIGKSVPETTKYLLFQVHEFSTKQLPSAERLALPSPEQKIKDAEVGKTVFQSIKRVAYNSLCNPESEIYKVWFQNGISAVLSKGYIRTAIVTCLASLGIGIKLISASIIALIIKFGLEVYCDKYKPIELMELRNR